MSDQPKKVRRDPRVERDRRRSRQDTGTLSAKPAPKSRPRKNPHARLVVAGAEGRKRILRGDARPVPGAKAGREKSAPVIEAADTALQIDDPTYLVAVVPDLPAGRPSSHDRDLLGAARSLADQGGGAVLAVLFETCRDDLGPAGADRVMRFQGEGLEGYSPGLRLAALESLMAQAEPRHLLFPDSPYGGGDLGRRLAARLGERAGGGIWKIDGEQALRRSDGGRQDETRPLTRVLLLAAEAAAPVRGQRYEAREVMAPAFAAAPSIQDLGALKVDPQDLDLGEAPFVVAAGNGLTDWDLYHALTQSLSAAEGGSRVVVDKGLMPRERQIGASGRRVTARCYLALGISGAPQHLEGITRCDRVLAVNRDPTCPMVKRADFAVIGDLAAILPALLALARERRRNV